MGTELKSCPFCGGEPNLQTTAFGRPVMKWVQCEACEAGATAYETAENACAAWNNRRTTPDREAIIEECAKGADHWQAIGRPDHKCGEYIAAAIRALKSAPTASQLAALDRLAENAHELGLGYEPSTKAEPYEWRDTGPLETGEPQ